MARLAAKVLVLIIIQVMALGSRAESDFDFLRWARKSKTSRGQTFTNLRFYCHDIFTGPFPTAVQVAEAAETNQSLTMFGAVMVTDDPLTEGITLNSRLIGRAQGIYGSAGRRDVTFVMATTFLFLDDMYNGSSISVLGRNQAMNYVREMPIVGGTGVFRFAHGYAIARTHRVNTLTGDATVWYNVTVFH